MKYNRKCAYCGRPYYVCLECIGKGSFAKTFCSMDCFKMGSIENGDFKSIIIDDSESKVFMRGKLQNEVMVDIIGYNLELGKYDCSDGTTRNTEDFEYFIVTRNEMTSIGEEIKNLNKKRTRRSSKTNNQNAG